MGVQCKGCCMLINLECTRISTNGLKIGVCWMEKGSGEYCC